MRKTAAALVVLGAAAAAEAGTISFDDFVHVGSDPVDYVVTIDDLTPGEFHIDVAVASGSPNTGSITGIAFDLASPLPLGISFASNPAYLDLQFGVQRIGGANLTPIPAFDVFLKLPKIGPTASIVVSNIGGLTLADFTRFGLRSQQVGPNGGGGSSKEFAVPHANVVPLPPSVWMGLGLLGLLGAVRVGRRRRAAHAA